MDAKEAGQMMRQFRNRKKLTQDQVVERSTVPTAQYLSALENGRYDIRNSDHFKSLVSLYSLTPEEVREVNPDVVIHFSGVSGGSPIRPPVEAVETPLEIPAGLQEAIELYGGVHPQIKNEQNLRTITSARFYGGTGPQTAEEWLDFFMANRRWLERE
ncbi:helix-turn-helix domain-containing protein [Deinococcus oregonensis]|uniref:Helix-turn-helix domain-containing protein n=1 Tax=Deinococcus oregonensis TaxID=1805970 RepID=A0ABV6B2W3_9DEIO